MPTDKTRPGGRDRTLTHDEFMAKHKSELVDSDEAGASGMISVGQIMRGEVRVSSSMPLKMSIAALLVELKRWWLVRLLRAASTENSPEAYNSLLRFWLHKMELDPPPGVFMPLPGMPGRPRSAKTDEIFLTWIDLGKPSLSSRKLAHAIYEAAFREADSHERKKMVDRCRRAVERRQAQLRPNPSPIKS